MIWKKLKILGDVTKFRLDPASIKATENLRQSFAYHLNWWVKLNTTEKGREFLKQPEILNYRSDVCHALNICFGEYILKCIRTPGFFKQSRQI